MLVLSLYLGFETGSLGTRFYGKKTIFQDSWKKKKICLFFILQKEKFFPS